MLSISNTNVIETLKLFNSARAGGGLDVTFLVPTATGYNKSIMDATQAVRAYLKKHKVHDYDVQLQGPNNKVLIKTLVFSDNTVLETTTSLYRPETKSGDPRIWVKGLKQLAQPTDLLALITSDDGIVVVNCSRTNLSDLIIQENLTFWQNFSNQYIELNSRATELLDKLRLISSKGFIKTLRRGDTGVGYTLETELGISANSSNKPDYKGIELKSARFTGRKSDRTTIFSKVPNWSISRLKGSKSILQERGYYSELKGRRQLFHTMSAIVPNSINMVLRVDDDFLYQDFKNPDAEMINDVKWDMITLQTSLLEKHKETFWVYAETRGRGEFEEFNYSKAKYTSGPDETKLNLLLETGVITVDYTITERPNGSAKDQGYLFKIRPDDIELLFNTPKEFNLKKEF